MKLRIAPAEFEDSDDIDLTPMIDCIFLLVLFFMLTSTFIEEAKVYKIVLPKGDQPATVSREDVDTISLTVDGEIYFLGGKKENRVESPEELLEKLKQRDESARSRPVVIRCDARCEYRQFMQIKNVLKLAGVEAIYEEVEVGDESTQP